jgi:hypothetical protein
VICEGSFWVPLGYLDERSNLCTAAQPRARADPPASAFSDASDGGGGPLSLDVGPRAFAPSVREGDNPLRQENSHAQFFRSNRT